MDANEEFAHFTVGNTLRHAIYDKFVRNRGTSISWMKRPGSEEDCLCPAYEADRNALRQLTLA